MKVGFFRNEKFDLSNGFDFFEFDDIDHSDLSGLVMPITQSVCLAEEIMDREISGFSVCSASYEALHYDDKEVSMVVKNRTRRDIERAKVREQKESARFLRESRAQKFTPEFDIAEKYCFIRVNYTRPSEYDDQPEMYLPWIDDLDSISIIELYCIDFYRIDEKPTDLNWPAHYRGAETVKYVFSDSKAETMYCMFRDPQKVQKKMVDTVSQRTGTGTYSMFLPHQELLEFYNNVSLGIRELSILTEIDKVKDLIELQKQIQDTLLKNFGKTI